MHTARLESTSQAAALLAASKIVAIPTETVFGLAADARCDAAIQAVFEAKGRPSDNPLIVHLAAIDRWPTAAAELPPIAQQLLAHFAPGPLTVIVPKATEISTLVSAGLDTVGLRIPGCPIAREVLKEADIPLAAPSANLSGRPSCTTWQSVLEDLDGRIDAVLCHNTPVIGIESTVIDCTGANPIVLRSGGISLEAIRRIYPETSVSASTPTPQASKAFHPPKDLPSGGQMTVKSPGTLHPHYQPKAQVVLCSSMKELQTIVAQHGNLRRVSICLLEPQADLANRTGENETLSRSQPAHNEVAAWLKSLTDNEPASLELHQRLFETLEAYASGYYEFLREADRRGAQLIIVQRVPEKGLGRGLADRQRRSAGVDGNE